jgi:hypothetical protein
VQREDCLTGSLQCETCAPSPVSSVVGQVPHRQRYRESGPFCAHVLSAGLRSRRSLGDPALSMLTLMLLASIEPRSSPLDIARRRWPASIASRAFAGSGPVSSMNGSVNFSDDMCWAGKTVQPTERRPRSATHSGRVCIGYGFAEQSEAERIATDLGIGTLGLAPGPTIAQVWWADGPRSGRRIRCQPNVQKAPKRPSPIASQAKRDGTGGRDVGRTALRSPCMALHKDRQAGGEFRGGRDDCKWH